MSNLETLLSINVRLKSSGPFSLNQILGPMKMIGGFTDKIIDFGYVETNMVLQHDQLIRLAGGEEYLIKAGNNAITLALTFQSGMALSISALRRSWGTTINGAKIATLDTTQDFGRFIGKTLTINSLSKDLNTERTRFYQDIKGQTLSRTDCGFTYKITII